MDKEIYNMTDGIPIWQHLKNGSKKGNVKLDANDHGRIAEIIGKKELFRLTMRGNLEKFFPNVAILSANKLNEGDFALEVSFQDGLIYGKNIVIFEIKHGKIEIHHRQLRRYCSMVINPDKFFKKANEVKVFFMLFDYIDIIGNMAPYTIRELDKDLAKKILEELPVSREEKIKTYEKWKINHDQQDTANLISALYGDVSP